MSSKHERVEELFWHASQLKSETERSAFLDEACGPDHQLRHEVEQLLSSRTAAEAMAEAYQPTLTVARHDMVGQTIGPYKLREKIGEGGMGVVYAAEQRQPLKRRVALKIIKPGMDSRQIIARFESERETLSLMDHPHIARVLDAGATDRGLPYFVMELVRGVPITEFADKQRLTLEERLRLFQDVCRAIQHAHQKGIIHRDIKPSNVMVTLHDGKPVVKVIDFGVAKAMGRQFSEHSVYTAMGQMVGTPMYMSPEQAELSGLDVDTRSDVYSLGVLLYELLTSMPLFDRDSLRQVGLEAMLRIIREREPEKPSLRLSMSRHELQSTIADSRRIDERRLSQSLRGELDWIVMKALEKDRTRRYGSSAEFAEDVQRFLGGQPVAAGPPSAIYRTRKFIRRHRFWLSSAGLILVAMMLGTGFSVYYAVQADAARTQAQESEALAQERLQLLQVEQRKLQEGQAKLRDEQQKLAAAQKVSDHNFALAKSAVAKLIDEVARHQLIRYPELGNFRASLYETADMFYSQLLEENPRSVEILLARAEVRQRLNRFSEQLDDYLAAEEFEPNNLRVLLRLSHYYRVSGDPGPNNRNRQVAIEKAQRAVEHHPEVDGAWSTLGWAYYELNRKDDAAQAMLKAAELANSAGEKAHRRATALEFAGKYAEAAESYVTAAETEGVREPFEDYHRGGYCLLRLQRYDEAIAILNKSIELDNYRFLPLLFRGQAYVGLGKPEQAVADFKRGLELRPFDRDFLHGLFDCYLVMNDVEAAAELLDIRSGEFTADHTLLNQRRLKWINNNKNTLLNDAKDRFLARVEAMRQRDGADRDQM